MWRKFSKISPLKGDKKRRINEVHRRRGDRLARAVFARVCRARPSGRPRVGDVWRAPSGQTSFLSAVAFVPIYRPSSRPPPPLPSPIHPLFLSHLRVEPPPTTSKLSAQATRSAGASSASSSSPGLPLVALADLLPSLGAGKRRPAKMGSGRATIQRWVRAPGPASRPVFA